MLRDPLSALVVACLVVAGCGGKPGSGRAPGEGSAGAGGEAGRKAAVSIVPAPPRPPGKPPTAAWRDGAVAFGFEGGAVRWTGVYERPRTARGIAPEGSRCLALATDRPVNREVLSPFFAIDPDRAYRVSALVRVDRFEPGYCPLAVNIRWYSRPEELFSFGGWNVFRVMREDAGEDRTFGWKRVERIVRPPRWTWMEGALTHARIQVRNYRTVGAAYVDAVRVEPVSGGAARAEAGSPPGR